MVGVNERAKENAQSDDSQRTVFLTGETDEEEEEEEEEDGDDGEDEDDQGDTINEEPPSCVGHFDRLDVEYTSKPAQARVYVYHDERRVATWSGTPLLQQNEASQHRDSVAAAMRRSGQLELDDSEMEGRGTPRGGPRIILSAPSDGQDEKAPDRLAPSTTFSSGVEGSRRQLRKRSNPPSPSSPQSPRRVLKKLRVSRTAVHLPESEDPFFAGRLAATSVIMVRDGLLAEAERLGRWSVDLVGKKQWDRMVECYGSSSRLDTDNHNWMASLFDDVHTSLQPIDEEKAAQLQGMTLEWQDMGILPRRSATPSEAT